MPIFEATANNLAAIPATNFAALGMKERADLQRLLTASPDYAPGLADMA